MTLNLHEYDLILYENDVGLIHGGLSASHSVSEGFMGSCKLCCCSGERANYIHDGHKIVGGNRDMRLRWCESARCSTICRGGTGAMGP